MDGTNVVDLVTGSVAGTDLGRRDANHGVGHVDTDDVQASCRQRDGDLTCPAASVEDRSGAGENAALQQQFVALRQHAFGHVAGRVVSTCDGGEIRNPSSHAPSLRNGLVGRDVNVASTATLEKSFDRRTRSPRLAREKAVRVTSQLPPDNANG